MTRVVVTGIPCSLTECALCGAGVETVSLLTAYAPDGDARAFAYSLCEPCSADVQRDHNVLEAVERRIDTWRARAVIYACSGGAA